MLSELKDVAKNFILSNLNENLELQLKQFEAKKSYIILFISRIFLFN